MVRLPRNDVPDVSRWAQDAPPRYFYARPDVELTGELPWHRVLRAFRKHWKAALALTLLLELGLAALVWSLEDLYEARAVLEVESPGASTLSARQAAPATPAQQEYLNTQTEILRGDRLALGVIQELGLEGNETFRRQDWLRKLVTQAGRLIPRGGQASGQTGTEELLDIFRAGLGIGQVGTSRLVEVRYESRDPHLSEQIVSTLVRQYMEQTHRSAYESTLRAAESLAPELSELQKSVEQSQQTLLDFQKSHEGVELGGLVSGGPGGTGALAGSPVAVRVAELNQQLTEAMGEKLQQESYMKLIAQGNVDALPQMKDSPLIQGLTARLVDSRAELAQALALYGGNHPQVRRLQLQTLELSTQLDAERNRIASQIRSAYESALNRERLLQGTLRQMKSALDRSNENTLRYEALRREAEANATLYTTLSSQVKELAIAGSLRSNNVRVVEQARLPEKPSGPRRFRILGIGLFFGLLGGVVLAFVKESMDDTISSSSDLRGWSGLPTLALLPRVTAPRWNRLPPSARHHAKTLTARTVTALAARGLKVLGENPQSPEAEAIRNLETAIRLPLPDAGRSVQTVLITSAFPGEGKTTVAINLALALARHGKTCLVDADFRHPVITSCFGLSIQPGLQDLLSDGHKPIQEICRPLPETPNLTVLGVGPTRPDAPDILTSARVRDLVAELRKNFEYVVLDSPPLIPFSEARWLSTLSDGSVLVARCSATTRRAMVWSLEILEELGAPILGVVLNDVDLQAEYYSYGGDGYSRYAPN